MLSTVSLLPSLCQAQGVAQRSAATTPPDHRDNTPSLVDNNCTSCERNDHRNKNLCDLATLVENNTTTLKDALNGTTLSIGFMTYMLEDNAINETNPHIGIRVMDELAKRAGFNYTFGVIDEPNSTTRTESNYSDWNDLLFAETKYYDALGTWFIKDVYRIEKGIVFPSGW